MSRIHLGFLILLVLLFPSAAVGQTGPIDLVGRYVNSESAPEQLMPQTIRAGLVKAAPEIDAILMALGGDQFAIYQLSTFVQRIQTESRATGPYGESYLEPAVLIDPDADPSWDTYALDGSKRLFDFDWDRRGYISLAYDIWGFAIVDVEGELVAQITDSVFFPRAVFTLEVGSSFFAVVSNGQDTTRIYDITDPVSPDLVRSTSHGIRDWAKEGDENTVAMILGSGSTLRELHTVRAVDLVAGLPTTKINGLARIPAGVEWSEEFYVTATDGSGTDLYSFDVSDSSLTLLDTQPLRGASVLGAGAGYVAFGGFSPPSDNFILFDTRGEDSTIPGITSGSTLGLEIHQSGATTFLIGGFRIFGELYTLPNIIDNDGIGDDVEDSAPNGGDGNGDGVPDSEQGRVTSLPLASGNGYATVVADCDLQNVRAVAISELPEPDLYNFPYGLIEFELPCATAHLQIFYHVEDAWAGGEVYRKYGPSTPGNPATTEWYTLPDVSFDTAMVGAANVPRASFTLADGSLGDDTALDGLIVDQGGPAAPLSQASIPAANQWMLLILTSAIAAIGFSRLR